VEVFVYDQIFGSRRKHLKCLQELNEIVLLLGGKRNERCTNWRSFPTMSQDGLSHGREESVVKVRRLVRYTPEPSC
jgi:hypothetical protein